MKKLVKLGLALGIFVGGFIAGNQTQPTEVKEQKTIVATQVAQDGSVQATYEDGTGFYYNAETGVTEEMPVVEVKKEKVEVTEVYYQDGDIQEYEGFYLEDGDTLIMLSDDSFGIANLQKNTFSFQPVDLGDWDYTVDNQQQFENIIKTYLSMKNNGWY